MTCLVSSVLDDVPKPSKVTRKRYFSFGINIPVFEPGPDGLIE